MPARDHHTRFRQQIPKRHRPHSFRRKASPCRDQSPLPFRKTPFQVEHVVPLQAKRGDKGL